MSRFDWRVLLGALLIACHRHAVRNDNGVERQPINDERVDREKSVERGIGDPKIAAMFKDTAPSTAFSAEGRTYDVQRPAERQALRDALMRERRLWQGSKPANYRFLFRSDCFCPGPQGWLVLDVRAGRPGQAWDRTGRPVARNDWTTFNIDQLFASFDRGNDQLSQVQIAFDERWHYPRFLRTSMIYPDGWSIIQIRALQPLQP
jgi:Family of unknown function (DUF6174)